ncbi:hypothetical protein [Vibrio crassostreae]|uniref:hypothetical protein n=1 Tax=Vibrio crassostreae TaxID=246167 RepID=UPI000632B751|nr:hypothetical protein [Vibrio crassostreae]CDT76577.1 hypothetical protein VCRLGP8_990037 [Vibrio crassostreae]
MDYDLSPIINGSLSLDGENAFYSKVKAELLKLIVREHDFELNALTKGELLRLASHLENIESDKYEDLKSIDSKLLLSTKLGLSAEIYKQAHALGPNSTISITFTD